MLNFKMIANGKVFNTNTVKLTKPNSDNEHDYLRLYISKEDNKTLLYIKDEFNCRFFQPDGTKGSLQISQLDDKITIEGDEKLEFTLNRDDSWYSWRNGMVEYVNDDRNIIIRVMDEYWDE
jgi:hypothetical protein